MKSFARRLVSKNPKVASAGRSRRKNDHSKTPQKPIPVRLSAAQVWKGLVQAVVQVRARAVRTRSLAASPPEINKDTRIPDVLSTPEQKRALAFMLGKTFHVRLSGDDIDRATTYGELATFIRHQLLPPLNEQP